MDVHHQLANAKMFLWMNSNFQLKTMLILLGADLQDALAQVKDQMVKTKWSLSIQEVSYLTSFLTMYVQENLDLILQVLDQMNNHSLKNAHVLMEPMLCPHTLLDK